MLHYYETDKGCSHAPCPFPFLDGNKLALWEGASTKGLFIFETFLKKHNFFLECFSKGGKNGMANGKKKEKIARKNTY
ncbi:MAG: hypothetical protein PHY23_01560 [Oscillospiraceae bacterium]|jgi:hypothetical protein|nr:hypothetical protein [Oscillospiraceae bacterium]